MDPKESLIEYPSDFPIKVMGPTHEAFAATIVEEKGLKQESDTGAIEVFVDQAIAANPGSVADFKAGKVSALNFLKGQVMKLSKGKANPALAGEILEKKLS
jgi:aspartyl-tRNA(Asn)/glutamyl-tRNA(Gln) amidotransferase subunit B